MCIKPAESMLSLSQEAHVSKQGVTMGSKAKSLPNNLCAPRVTKQYLQPAMRWRRPRRVLYPSQVRKYLPPKEKDPAKRWLFFLGAVMLLQVCTEESAQNELVLPEGLIDHEPDFMLLMNTLPIMEIVTDRSPEWDSLNRPFRKESGLAITASYFSSVPVRDGKPVLAVNSTTNSTPDKSSTIMQNPLTKMDHLQFEGDRLKDISVH